jgi:hypothetical protein
MLHQDGVLHSLDIALLEHFTLTDIGGQFYVSPMASDGQVDIHGEPGDRGSGSGFLGDRPGHRGGEEGVQHDRRLHSTRRALYSRSAIQYLAPYSIEQKS